MANRVRIKMCGMTRKNDIAYAAELGVDAAGLIFYEKSPRHVTIAQAKKLLLVQPVFMDIVAVMVNPDVEFVDRILQELPIQWLQFHGTESPAFCEQFRVPYIKAIAAQSKDNIIKAINDYQGADAIMLDTPAGDRHGGTGKTFDWQIIPENTTKSLILAGGLNPDNVKEAVTKCHPWAVDVSSGVEVSPGIKDYEKMRLFVQAIGGSR